MNVRELKERLESLPDDMPVYCGEEDVDWSDGEVIEIRLEDDAVVILYAHEEDN